MTYLFDDSDTDRLNDTCMLFATAFFDTDNGDDRVLLTVKRMIFITFDDGCLADPLQ